MKELNFSRILCEKEFPIGASVNKENQFENFLTVVASQKDSKILYWLTNQVDDPIQENTFSIEQETGLLSAIVDVEFDGEKRDTYELMVLARMADQPSRSATFVFAVRILDSNDNIPHITLPAPLHLSRYLKRIAGLIQL